MSFSKEMPDNQDLDYKKDFANFFGPIMPHIRSLKNIGHFGSFLTACYAVNGIIQNHFGFAKTIFLVSLSVGLAVLACWAIEFGISTILPMWSRQLIRWKFQNRWFAIMFGILTIIVVPLVFISPLLSGDGAEDALKDYSIKIEAQNSDHLNEKYDSEKESVMAAFNERKSRIIQPFVLEKKAVESKYEGLIQIQYNNYDHYKIKKSEGNDWAQSHIDAAVRERKKLQAERSSELASISRAQSSALLPLLQEENLELAAITQLKVSTVSHFHALDSTRMAYLTSKQTRREFTASGIAKVCVLLVVICIFVTEVYEAGSGHEIETQEYIRKNRKLKKWNIGGTLINYLFPPSLAIANDTSDSAHSDNSDTTDTSGQPDTNSETKTETNQSQFLDNQEISLIQVSSSDDLISMLRNSYVRRITTKNILKRNQHKERADIAWQILIQRGFGLKPISETGFRIFSRP